MMMLLPNMALSQDLATYGNWTYNRTPVENLCLLDGIGEGFSITFAFEPTAQNGIGGIGLSFEGPLHDWTGFSIETSPDDRIYFSIVDRVYTNGLLTLRGDFDNPKDIAIIDMFYKSPMVHVTAYSANARLDGNLDTTQFSTAIVKTNECILRLDEAL